MKKLILWLVLFMFLVSCEKKEDIIKVGIINQGQAFDWLNSDGKIEGISVSCFEDFFKQENQNYELVLCNKRTVFMDLEAGIVDLVVAPSHLLNESDGELIGSTAYLNPKMLLINTVLIEESQLNEDYTILYENSQQLENKLKELYPEAKLVAYTDFMIGLQSMQLNEKVILLAYEEQYNSLVTNSPLYNYYSMNVGIENPCVIISKRENSQLIKSIDHYFSLSITVLAAFLRNVSWLC